MEDGNSTSAFFLAFDCLDHNLLQGEIIYFYLMGFRGLAEKWMSSYLKEKLHMVEITYTKNYIIKLNQHHYQ